MDVSSQTILSNADAYILKNKVLYLIKKDSLKLINKIFDNGTNIGFANKFENKPSHYKNGQYINDFVLGNMITFHENGIAKTAIGNIKNQEFKFTFFENGRLMQVEITKPNSENKTEQLLWYKVSENNQSQIVNGDGFVNDNNDIVVNEIILDTITVNESGRYKNGYKDGKWVGVQNGNEFIEYYKVGKLLKGVLTENETDKIYNTQLFELPKFKGGNEKLLYFLQSRIINPEKVDSIIIQKKLMVSFFVEKNGECHGFEIIEGYTKKYNDELMRILKKMPKWLPATYRGMAIKSKIVLPITYNLLPNWKDRPTYRDPHKVVILRKD